MAWRFCLTNTCFALLPSVYSSMVPGNLPSQLEILSTGQTYYGTCTSGGTFAKLSNEIHPVMSKLPRSCICTYDCQCRALLHAICITVYSWILYLRLGCTDTDLASRKPRSWPSNWLITMPKQQRFTRWTLAVMFCHLLHTSVEGQEEHGSESCMELGWVRSVLVSKRCRYLVSLLSKYMTSTTQVQST